MAIEPETPIVPRGVLTLWDLETATPPVPTTPCEFTSTLLHATAADEPVPAALLFVDTLAFTVAMFFPPQPCPKLEAKADEESKAKAVEAPKINSTSININAVLIFWSPPIAYLS